MDYTDGAIRLRKKKKEKLENKINIAVCIIIIPLLIYNLSLMVQAIVNPHKTPAFLGIKMYVIVSGSMEPELMVGDIVIVSEILENELVEGDIISFRRGQSIITHRIARIFEENGTKKYITKGDKNNVEDTMAITYECIEGKVNAKIGKIGKIVLALKDKIVIFTIVLF